MQSQAWKLHLNQVKFPRIQREAVLLIVYNLFEYQLLNLCNILSYSLVSEVSIKDLKGAGVNRSILFLEKVARFDFSTFNEERLFFSGVNRIRNLIVHNDGEVSSDENSPEYKFINSKQGISLDAERRVAIDGDFIICLIDFFREYIEKINTQVVRYMQRPTG